MSGAANRPAVRSSWLRDMSIRRKLAGIVFVGAAALIVVSAVATQGLSDLESASERLYHDGQLRLSALNEVDDLASAMEIHVGHYALSPDATATASIETEMAATDDALDVAVVDYGALDPAEGDRVALLQAAITEFRSIRDAELRTAWAAGDDAGVVAIFSGTLAEAGLRVGAAVDDLIDATTASGETLAAESAETYRRDRLVLFAVGGVALVLLATIGKVIADSVLRPLLVIRRVLGNLADGDLGDRARLETRDEIGRMGDDLDQALERTSDVMGKISESAVTLASAAEEISATSDQLASNAENTAERAIMASAAAEEVSVSISSVASSTEEMSIGVSEVSKSAHVASSTASEAVEVAAVASLALGRLEQSSARIGDILATITGIAEQTNLLALNATIESARAGDMGKGFAVVASEVKDLASETRSATGRIGSTVADIHKDVTDARSALERISAVVGNIDESQQTIAGAVEQQAAATSEISRSLTEANDGVGQITHSIQDVAEVAGESKHAAGEATVVAAELASLATALQTMVGHFRLAVHS